MRFLSFGKMQVLHLEQATFPTKLRFSNTERIAYRWTLNGFLLLIYNPDKPFPCPVGTHHNA